MVTTTTSSELIEIPIKRAAVVFRCLGALGFIVLAVFMWQSDNHRPLAVLVFGCFGAALGFGLKVLLDPKPALVLDPEGLLINGNVGSGGRVPWSDIISFGLVQYGRIWSLTVMVKQPEKYLARGNYIYRTLNRLSYGIFNTPVRINTTILDLERDQLLSTANECQQKYANHA